ncbi:hypothetical protein OSB04_011251 [Centaurea solstitialis]|uniref:Uncharacterized protein n=1 Tax=Centaurea solstitialis TaxID=347529 RepID=A0AA38WDI5_9ASTR|nr:hypothetical protein OSB04_011251 [Centaurea solstitialis]
MRSSYQTDTKKTVDFNPNWMRYTTKLCDQTDQISFNFLALALAFSLFTNLGCTLGGLNWTFSLAGASMPMLLLYSSVPHHQHILGFVLGPLDHLALVKCLRGIVTFCADLRLEHVPQLADHVISICIYEPCLQIWAHSCKHETTDIQQII